MVKTIKLNSCVLKYSFCFIALVATAMFLSGCASQSQEKQSHEENSVPQENKNLNQVSLDLVDEFSVEGEKIDKSKFEETIVTDRKFIEPKDSGDKKTENNQSHKSQRESSHKKIKPKTQESNSKYSKNSKSATVDNSKDPVLSEQNSNKPNNPTSEVSADLKVLTLTGDYPENYPEEFKKYDEESKKYWSMFRPFFFKGESTKMAITYLGVTAGHITITSKNVVQIDNKIAYNYVARFKSNESYSYFYWLDDQLSSFVEKDTFLPIKYSLIQREKKQNVDDLQLFDFQKLKTYTFYKRIKKDSNKDEKLDVFIPKYAQDSFSALQFVRGMPLNIKDHYEFPVVTRGKIWKLKVDVVAHESIEVLGKKIDAIKIKAETHFPGVLKKSGDIFFWYSHDELRKLLKFQAKIKIGSIFGEIEEYTPGERVQ